jgi:hypothetical protein
MIDFILGLVEEMSKKPALETINNETVSNTARFRFILKLDYS